MITPKEYIILEEAEVAQLLTPTLAYQVIEQCFHEKAAGTFNALAKINIKGSNGDLRITPGESTANLNIIGFRLYDVIRRDFSQQPQLTVVYHNGTGQLKGLVISQLLGAYRTAAINAVMHNRLRKRVVHTLGIVGTGYQARTHLPLFAQVLQPKKIVVYGRTPKNVQQFVHEMKKQLHPCPIIEIATKRTNLYQVDSLLLTTRSTEPLFNEVTSFKAGITITSIGPKFRTKSELSNAFAQACDLVVTDAIEQVHKYADNFFMQPFTSIQDYASLLRKNGGRTNEQQKILICSLGMGGTEVALANALLERKRTLLQTNLL